MKVNLSSNLEADFPVTVHIPQYGNVALTFLAARKLSKELTAAVGKVERHFMCPDETGTISAGPFRCCATGKIKDPFNGRWYCKRHAGKVKP